MRIVVISVFLFFLFGGCSSPSPEILIPNEYMIGQSFNISISGLNPGEEYSVIANKIDSYDRSWISKAKFIVDNSGIIDLDSDKPSSGSYKDADGNGIFWSMTMSSPTDKDWEAPMPKDYALIEFLVVSDIDTILKKTTKQWVIPPSVEFEALEGDLIANIFRPKDTEEILPGILLLGGSGGGLSWARRVGALLASEGYITMALAYFNSGDLPQHLAEIPLEYVFEAIDVLKEEDQVDANRIGLLGYSKGAELALITSSRRNDIHCVAVIAPGSAVFQGFKPPKYPVISSWSLNGEGLTFVPNNYDSHFFKTYDGMYLWYRTLNQYDKVEAASIPVEKINGNILLMSGVEDQIWPSTYMAEQIISRLHVNGFENSYAHLAFPNAGHGIAEPPGHPTSSLSERLGGTPSGNSKAREISWEKIKEFFSNAFQSE